MTFLVVVGDAGMSAASKARREDPDREIVALDSGATRFRRQGEFRSALDASDCP